MRPHGIMLHHFHDEQKHIVEQGSISAETFEQMLDYYAASHTILNADEWMDRELCGTIQENDVCITFDDALLCQYDIAYPVLKRRGIKAFWFVYTAPLMGELNRLELYRHFRFQKFNDIDSFYEQFFSRVISQEATLRCNTEEKLARFIPEHYYPNRLCYTRNDRIFRYMRDTILGEEKYEHVMDNMLKEFHYDMQENRKLLWMNEEQIADLHNSGQVIGLHTHTHPTVLTNMSAYEQEQEYTKNQEILQSIIQDRPNTVSHPCSSYDDTTLAILKKLGVKLGFYSNMVGAGESLLELPRLDHADLLCDMNHDNESLG